MAHKIVHTRVHKFFFSTWVVPYSFLVSFKKEDNSTFFFFFCSFSLLKYIYISHAVQYSVVNKILYNFGHKIFFCHAHKNIKKGARPELFLKHYPKLSIKLKGTHTHRQKVSPLLFIFHHRLLKKKVHLILYTRGKRDRVTQDGPCSPCRLSSLLWSQVVLLFFLERECEREKKKFVIQKGFHTFSFISTVTTAGKMKRT